MTDSRLRLTAFVIVTLIATGAARAGQLWSPRLERRVLEALDARQAEAFAAGAAAAEIRLADGGTLDEFLARTAAEASVALAFTPLDPCLLVRTAGSAAGVMTPGATRAFQARGSLRAQGGAIAGCGVPDDARAIAVAVRVVARGKGSLFLGPASTPLESLPVQEYAGAGNVSGLAIFELCQGESCEADFQARVEGASAHIVISTVGYYAPVALADGVPGLGRTPRAIRGLPGPAGSPGPRGATGAPGPSCKVESDGATATLVCPDGSAVTWLAPSPTVRSFHVVAPEITVAALQEITYCYYFRTPNTETVGIRRWATADALGGPRLEARRQARPTPTCSRPAPSRRRIAA